MHDHSDHHYDHGDAGGGRGHTHAPKSFGRAFAIGIALNAGFVAVEAGYGFASNSLALVADAGHNLSDVLGLVVAWVAAELSKRKPSERFTYGLRSSSILAALFNAAFLLIAVGAIGWEALLRLFDPKPIAELTVMAVAAAGVLVNGFTAWLFASGRHGDLNIRGAYLHMAADAGVSVGVVVAGLVTLLTGWLWLDPVVSLAIVVVIAAGTWGLLRDSLTMSLNAVPPGVNFADVQAFLAGRPGVEEVHDLHIWSMSTTETVLTAHLVMPGGHPGDAVLRELCDALSKRFRIGHATLQIEMDGSVCPLAPNHLV